MRSDAGSGREAAPSYGAVWALAWPIILANSSVPLLGMVDTAVVGHLPETHLIGAVAVGAMVFSWLYWGFGFLRMGTGGLTAQAVGAREPDEIRAVLGRALLLSAVFGAALIAIQVPAIDLALYLVGASPEVAGSAREYFLIRIWSAPAALAVYCLIGWFIGMQNTRITLMIQLFMNGLNIVLDLIFVWVFEWGVAGVAWATLVAEVAAAVLALGLAARAMGRLGGRWHWGGVLHRARMRRMLLVNSDIFVRTLLLVFVFSYFTTLGARFGDLTLAANAVLMHLLSLQAFGLDGFAHAAEALVGKAIGARDRHSLRRAVAVSFQMALTVAGLYAVFTLLFGEAVVAMLTNQADVRAFAADYLIWLTVSPLVAVWAFQLDGIFIGATQTRELRNGAILSVAVFLSLVWWLPDMFGNHGLWLALTVWLGARGLTLALFYPRIAVAAAA